MSEALRCDLVALIDNSTSVHRWTDIELTLGSAYLESFVFQARSLLDVYMHYVCLVMNVRQPGKMGWGPFKDKLLQIRDERFRVRAANVSEYFEQDVFSQPAWGWLLRELRDKIPHSDRLCPRNQNTECLVGVHLDWPTIRGLTLESLAQSFDNGMFELLRRTTPQLFLLEWKSEPYRPDLWDA